MRLNMQIGATRLRTLTLCYFLALGLVSVVGCNHKSESSPEPIAPSSPVVSIDSATVGSISGTVTLEGKAPEVGGIVTPCGKASSSRGISPVAVSGSSGGLANVVIYLKSGLASYRYDVPTTPVLLDQKGCVYEPRVIALMTNQPLEIRNEDPVAHNIHVLAKANQPWNHSEPPGVAPITESFSKPERAMRVICKLHPGMNAYLFIFDNPYYAVTSPTGTFELKNLPPGTYTVEAWQEQLGTQDQTVTIGPKQSKTVSFAFKSKNPSGD